MADYLRWAARDSSMRRYEGRQSALTTEVYHAPSGGRESLLNRSVGPGMRAYSAASGYWPAPTTYRRDDVQPLRGNEGLSMYNPSTQYSPKRPSSSGIGRPLGSYAADSYVPTMAAAANTSASFITQAARPSTAVTRHNVSFMPSTTPSFTSPYHPNEVASYIRPSSASISTMSTGSRAANTMPGLLRPTAMSHSKPLLILDLDETLVHASVDRRPTGHDFQFPVTMGSDTVTVYVKVRPFADEFLRRMSQLFEICVFTASVSAYADGVLNRIDPQRRYVHHRLYREHCTFTQGNYVKDLSRMGRPLERLCLVDNSPITYAMHPENGVPITSWFDNPHDNELIHISPMLEHFARSGNFYESARIYGLRR